MRQVGEVNVLLQHLDVEPVGPAPAVAGVEAATGLPVQTQSNHATLDFCRLAQFKRWRRPRFERALRTNRFVVNEVRKSNRVS